MGGVHLAEGIREHSNEPSRYKKCRKFLDYLTNYQLLKYGSLP